MCIISYKSFYTKECLWPCWAWSSAITDSNDGGRVFGAALLRGDALSASHIVGAAAELNDPMKNKELSKSQKCSCTRLQFFGWWPFIIALAHTMLKIGIWVRTLYQFFLLLGAKYFHRKKCLLRGLPMWFLLKLGFHAFLGISGRFYGDFRCPRAAEIHIFCM